MPLRLLPAAVAVLLVLVAPARAADVPRPGALYADGPSGRHLLAGEWLFRADPQDVGLSEGWSRSTSTTGWTEVEVPHAWNAGDDSAASMVGGIGWYRKDFRLPDADAALDWVARFESVNNRTRVWLNGRPVGENRGGYLPFELELDRVKRRGTNRLVLRVDSRRLITDFPPGGMNSQGVPIGGWWNYGGILREVYLRRIDTLDLREVRVEPVLRCGTCDATVKLRAVVRNVSDRAHTVAVTGRFGGRALRLGMKRIAAGGVAAFRTSFVLKDPRLWSPERPRLYSARLDASAGGKRMARHSLRTGVRSVKVTADGRLAINGRYANVRGVGFHEDTRERGAAITAEDRRWLVAEAQALGATMMRTHYPPHPDLLELADREGMLIWSEIPVYQSRNSVMARRSSRAQAVRLLERNIVNNWNHPSVVVWSIANELSSKPGPTQGYYIRAATARARQLDPRRPVGLAVAGYPSAGCQPEYAPLDVIGINEYFGWYPGPGGTLFDRSNLSPYLDSVRACYPDKAIMITEFGAEANRDGPVEEKGTWLHQQDFVNFHLGVFASKPWLSGALYWALNEFRVRPEWEGGNPRPQPPVHQKGLVTYDRSRKPAWSDAQRLFKGTAQFARRRP